MPTVSFLPSGTRVEVEPGTPLSDACRRAGFALASPCGGKGLCGKCRVKTLRGNIPVDIRQRQCLPGRLLARGWRAACAVRVFGDVTLADPVADAEGVILTDFESREPRGESGLWERDVVMPPPADDDRRDDETRFRAGFFEAEAEAGAGESGEPPILPRALFRDLPDILRDAGFRCRVVGLGRRILGIAPSGAGGRRRRRLGLAVDLGTTTLAAALCDLGTGEILSLSSRANPQSRHGDDVISRLEYASGGERERDELRRLAVGAIEELATETRRLAGDDADEPLLVAVAANTVMNHLLLGVSPRALAASPFIPAFLGPLDADARDLGWRGRRPPLFHVVPNIASYVGGDVAAGLLAHDAHRLEGRTLFLDIGTNGEIVLADNGRLRACATAAGPAFEGARIRQGMRAAPGAISRVGVSPAGALETGTVDLRRPALGLCGTGLLDAVAAAVREGLVDAGGRMLSADEARAPDAGVKPALAALLHDDEDGRAWWLERPGGREGRGVSLTQRDVREFQLAKGAIAAGVRVLLETAGIRAAEVDRVLLAGGFGNYLDPASALAVGLLPPDIPLERVRSVGNAALAGARLCLLSADERREAAGLAARVEYLELSGSAGFQAAFAEEMLFPGAAGEF